MGWGVRVLVSIHRAMCKFLFKKESQPLLGVARQYSEQLQAGYIIPDNNQLRRSTTL
jgi:hypothetical protein